MRLWTFSTRAHNSGGDSLPGMGDVSVYAVTQVFSHRIGGRCMLTAFAPETRLRYCRVTTLTLSDRLRHLEGGRRLVPDQSAQRIAENQFVLDAFDCKVLIFHSSYADMIARCGPA